MKCVLRIYMHVAADIAWKILRIHKVTNTMSTVYTTLDYEYRHKNKGTDLILVPRKCGVYIQNQESSKMCTVLIDEHEMHTKYSSSHTEVTNVMPTVYTTLDYGYRHKNKGTDQVWYVLQRSCMWN